MPFWNPSSWKPPWEWKPWEWPKDVLDALSDTGKAAISGIQSAWDFTEDQANEAYSKMKEAANWTDEHVVQETVAGIEDGAKLLGQGAELAGEGLVELGKYTANHFCSVSVSAVLAGALAAEAATGEEEVAFGTLASICASKALDTAALDNASKTAAFLLVEPIYLIPVVSHFGNKKTLTAAVAFAIKRACEQEPEKVAGTGGQYLPGIIIYIVSAYICEGKLPVGFEIWRGAQPEFN